MEHLATQLPEIVSHILSFLIANYSQEDQKKKLYADLYPCLFVNRLWHDWTIRAMWRNVAFEDTKADLDKFLKFASIIYNEPIPTSTKTPIEYVDQPEYLKAEYTILPETLLSKIEENDVLQQEQYQLVEPTRLKTYRHSMRSLSVRKIKEKSVNEPLSKIGQTASKLEHLDIYICDYFSSDALYPFLVHRQLTYLSLAGCHHISDEAVLKVAEYCDRLEHLDLRACGLVSDVSLSAIALNCPQLRHLNVGRIRDREKVTTKSIGLIAKHTQASVLGLAGCDIDDECLKLLAMYRTTGLERVSANGCFKISNKTVYAFLRYCPNLSVFEMKECHLISDWEAVAELVQRKVLLTLCDQQSRACTDWARVRGRTLDVRAPLK
ncbi:RNI-like protein [Backusella circina FSU 941]|nr:RNI-like protein [Backusella circina FSU 941]